MVIPQSHLMILSLVLLTIGVVGVLIRRNVIIILMSIELILNAANINFVAFAWFPATYRLPGGRLVYCYPFEVEGMMFALFVIVLAAAEAAVALAIVLNFYNNHMTVDVDTAEELKG